MESHPDQTAAIFLCVQTWYEVPLQEAAEMHEDGEQALSACSTLHADEARSPERPMRSATTGTTTPREMWEPSVLVMLEKLEGCMTDVVAM